VDRTYHQFCIDDRNGSCLQTMRDLIREPLEYYFWSAEGLSADTPLGDGYGEASRAANPIVEAGAQRACSDCKCRALFEHE
jgi:hypothetical protein